MNPQKPLGCLKQESVKNSKLKLIILHWLRLLRIIRKNSYQQKKLLFCILPERPYYTVYTGLVSGYALNLKHGCQ